MEASNGPARIPLPRRQHRVVAGVVQRWQDEGVLDAPTASRLRDSISVASFDWRRAARYALIAAVACFVIAIAAVLADGVLLALVARLFSAPALAKSGVFALAAAGLFALGLSLRRRSPHRVYSNESVFFVGVLALAVAVFYLGVAIDTGSGRASLLFLLAAVLYALLGLGFPSTLVWVFALLALGAWMGAETGYLSGSGAYFLGMNYPMRFVVFGAVLTAIAIGGERAWAAAPASTLAARLRSMVPATKVVGLLYLFVALWILSIFGNLADPERWQKVRQVELLHWSVLFGAVAVASIAYGLRRDDGAFRGFGLTFLFINLYTRFFEYFWNATHKAVFFAVLAASFWFLGRRAEAIWQLGRRGRGGAGGASAPASGGAGAPR